MVKVSGKKTAPKSHLHKALEMSSFSEYPEEPKFPGDQGLVRGGRENPRLESQSNALGSTASLFPVLPAKEKAKMLFPLC